MKLNDDGSITISIYEVWSGAYLQTMPLLQELPGFPGVQIVIPSSDTPYLQYQYDRLNAPTLRRIQAHAKRTKGK